MHLHLLRDFMILASAQCDDTGVICHLCISITFHNDIFLVVVLLRHMNL